MRQAGHVTHAGSQGVTAMQTSTHAPLTAPTLPSAVPTPGCTADCAMRCAMLRCLQAWQAMAAADASECHAIAFSMPRHQCPSVVQTHRTKPFVASLASSQSNNQASPGAVYARPTPPPHPLTSTSLKLRCTSAWLACCAALALPGGASGFCSTTRCGRSVVDGWLRHDCRETSVAVLCTSAACRCRGAIDNEWVACSRNGMPHNAPACGFACQSLK